jgi:hypothetical protein
MHKDVYNFFNDLVIDDRIVFFTEPASICIIDNFLPKDIYGAAITEINAITAENWSIFENISSSRKECRNFIQAPLLETITNSFNSSNAIHWLEKLTGVSGLLPDPHLRGGGLCRILSGNKLDLHTDFNWNDQIRLNRKVNLILYLNQEWDTSWGGNLEFWDNDKTRCVRAIEPMPNRLVIWNYDPSLIHGLSERLVMPAGVSRDNLIHFYYTSNATWEVAPRRSQFK